MKLTTLLSYENLKRWSLNLLLFAVVFNGISYWRELKLLPADGRYQAPSLSLPQLSGPLFNAESLLGKKTVVYFFAPWCQICHLSMGNLEDFYQTEQNNTHVIAVALSYDSRNEVADFVADKGLSFPVLLGTNELMSEYRINGFPSYYVLDEQGLIVAKSQGYSTALGIKLRAML